MQTLCMFSTLMGLNKQEECNEMKQVMSAWQQSSSETNKEVEMACLCVIKLDEESWLGYRQLLFKNCRNCSTQLLVHIRVKATNGHQLTISCRILSSTKRHRYWSLQHNHHVLHIDQQTWNSQIMTNETTATLSEKHKQNYRQFLFSLTIELQIHQVMVKTYKQPTYI